MSIFEEIRDGCAKANPEPCDPLICGILGIPCERCMPDAFAAMVAYAEHKEQQQILTEIDALEKTS